MHDNNLLDVHDGLIVISIEDVEDGLRSNSIRNVCDVLTALSVKDVYHGNISDAISILEQ